MSVTEFGVGVVRPRWIFKCGFTTAQWCWVPCLIEWGKATPADNFYAFSERTWLWGWLCFVVFLAKAGD